MGFYIFKDKKLFTFFIFLKIGVDYTWEENKLIIMWTNLSLLHNKMKPNLNI